MELSECMFKCSDLSKCFFVGDYFYCDHYICYNSMLKFVICPICFRKKKKRCTHQNQDEVVMHNNILNKNNCKNCVLSCN